ncbi:MAG: transcription antitermination factor NusB [Betaproteobacteria bacterium]|nr:transcription antitermination factor NusB [Betaproteobacteria bacterium]
MNQPAASRGTPAKSARRRSRELALQGLYEWLVSASEPGTIEAHLQFDNPGFVKADRDHFQALLHGVISANTLLHEAITPHLDRPVAELSPVEHAVLLLGVFELMHHPEIPYRVVINEAVELAKTFGGTDGYKYVNGVLDRVALKVRAVEISPPASDGAR